MADGLTDKIIEELIDNCDWEGIGYIEIQKDILESIISKHVGIPKEFIRDKDMTATEMRVKGHDVCKDEETEDA